VSATDGGWTLPATGAVEPVARPSRRLPRAAATPAPLPLVVAAGVMLVGLAGVLAYALIPQATVVMYPLGRPVAETFELRADPSLRAVDTAGARVPARVGYVVVEVVEQAQTLGRLAAPDARAHGSITFANRVGGPVVAPAGTIILTPSGARFVTQGETAVDGPTGSTARAGIEALEPGERGNVGRLEINRIVGPLAAQLAVLNEEPTVGGGQSSVPVVVESDVARVRQLAADHARSDALTKLQGGADDDESLVLQTLDFTTLEERVDRRPGDQVASFSYRLRARVSGVLVASGDVDQVVRASWQPSIPPGYSLPPSQLQIGAPQVVRTGDRAVAMRVPVQSVAVPPVDSEAIRDRVRWREPDEARRDLARSFQWAAEPRVSIQPRWATRALRVKLVMDLNEPMPGVGG
jgi:Baseplate J-like protein